MFTHDCQKCEYKGHATVNEVPTDFYHCDGVLGGSFIARYGDAGHEYWSMAVDILKNAELDSSGYVAVGLDLLGLEARHAR